MLILLWQGALAAGWVSDVIARAQQALLRQRQQEPFWNFPPYLGTLFLSQYYFQLRTLGLLQRSQFDVGLFTRKLLEEQEQDGSWRQIIEPNIQTGDLDSTIFNYWFLRETGGPEQALARAKAFILRRGGFKAAQVMTKFKLAAYGQYPWQDLPYIPLFLFERDGLYRFTYIKDYVAQWVYPHLLGLAYLRYHKVRFPTNHCLQEFFPSPLPCSQPPIPLSTQEEAAAGVRLVLEELTKLRGNLGSFGAYTVSTLLALLSFEDYKLRYQPDNYTAYYQTHKDKSFSFTEMNYFNRRVPYFGSLDDGRWWDSILAAWALAESGIEDNISAAVDYMIENGVQPNGGIPYGLDFQYAPDLDDTAMLVLLMSKFGGRYKAQIKKSVEFVVSMLNPDGGVPAFDKDKNDGQHLFFTLAFWFTEIDKSAEIFDPSCPDIVGHFLQAIGCAGLHSQHEEAVQRMLEYLRNSQQAEGGWQGRWGVNYLYSFGAVLPGLAAVGQDLTQDWVRKAVEFVLQRQNSDGGWGESILSYTHSEWRGKGVSTPTQTAWVLLGLREVRGTKRVEQAIATGLSYLREEQREDGTWFDGSVVGTGHRGVLYLQYPVYPFSFPLVALSRLRQDLAETGPAKASSSQDL